MDSSKGKINFKLEQLLKEKGIAKYKLHTLTGIKILLVNIAKVQFREFQ